VIYRPVDYKGICVHLSVLLEWFYTESTVADIGNSAVGIVSCYWADLRTHVITIYFI